MKIGFIGFGEAAYNIAFGLNTEGMEGIVAYDAMANHEVMGIQVNARAKKANVTLLNEPQMVAEACDVIFAAVPSSFTLDVCHAIKEYLNDSKLYVDVSASTPKIKKEIWDIIKGSGVLFVDAAMLGSLPKDKHRVPITASGNGAVAFNERMAPLGMKITLAGEGAGDASAIKLVRSIFMKGISTLMLEMLQAADAYGVADEVVASVGESMDGIAFTSHLDRLVTGSALHSARRAAEMKGSIAMLEEAGLSAEMTVATKHRLEDLAQFNIAEKFVTKSPEGWQEIINIIKK